VGRFYSDFLWDVRPPRATQLRSFVFRDHIDCLKIVLDNSRDDENEKLHPVLQLELFELNLMPADYDELQMKGIQAVDTGIIIGSSWEPATATAHDQLM
jgi:hypothetical protein